MVLRGVQKERSVRPRGGAGENGSTRMKPPYKKGGGGGEGGNTAFNTKGNERVNSKVLSL